MWAAVGCVGALKGGHGWEEGARGGLEGMAQGKDLLRPFTAKRPESLCLGLSVLAVSASIREST